jgi:hypothetical protein
VNKDAFLSKWIEHPLGAAGGHVARGGPRHASPINFKEGHPAKAAVASRWLKTFFKRAFKLDQVPSNPMQKVDFTVDRGTRWQRGPSVLGIRESVSKNESETGNLEIRSLGYDGHPALKPESYEKIW